MSSHPNQAEIDAALLTLVRALAPHLEPRLAHQQGDAVVSPGAPRDITEDAATDFVKDLPPDVVEGGLLLFGALRSDRHEVDSITLADRAGLSTRELSGRIIRPLQQRATELGLKDPWKASRAAPSGDLGSRTIWRADGRVAELLYQAFKKAIAVRAPSAKDPPSLDRATEVLPSAVFTYAPEYARGVDATAKEGWSSCLRTSEPGSRAVIYRAHSDPGLVAIFDVTDWPEADRTWAYIAPGYFTPIKPPVPRARLLADPELEKVFRHIQGRRRLPLAAQEAMAKIIDDTTTPLPPHALMERDRQGRDKRRR
jgi:hypothetical protein